MSSSIIPPALLDQGRYTAHLEGAADPVKRVSVIAHDLSGLRNIA